MTILEGNIDGLIGSTHNYAGLAIGNVASQSNAKSISRPRAAALQGLAKMKLLHSLGIRQMVMPPQPRPFLPLLRNIGCKDVAHCPPPLLPYLYSASGMWAANAATVTPSMDAADKRVHFSPANLLGTAHRSIEAEFTARALRHIFRAECFSHHAPLPANLLFTDEGAANHMRLSAGEKGVHIFVYGREDAGLAEAGRKSPSRQGLQASHAVARRHGIKEGQAVFWKQSARAIDAGVFHNDVIATSHEDALFYHEAAYEGGDAPVQALHKQFPTVRVFRVAEKALSLEDAVSTYLFNSQIITTPRGLVLIAPVECETHRGVREVIQDWPLAAVHYVDVRESMKNGGGPACLRLRLPLNEKEWAQVHGGVVFSDALHDTLAAWVKKHYRETLTPEELRDPLLASESLNALDELQTLLQLPGLYDNYL